jgi:ABC-2 type transport system ATP-binding protein
MGRERLVDISELRKTFVTGLRRRKVQAVRNVSFSVDEGEIFGVVGPNGAGKTTTIKMLTGLVRPDSGHATIFGRSAREIQGRSQLGYLPEGPYFYEHLRVDELLRFYGNLFNIPRKTLDRRIEELIERVGLSHAIDRPIKKFSKGMRQRAGLAQALINDPRLVILDEPQSGLDPMGRKEVRDLIFDLKKQGKTVLFSSHILPDVEAVCDRIAVIHLGETREVGSLESLVSRKVSAVEIHVGELERSEFPDLFGDVEIEERAEVVVLRCTDDDVTRNVEALIGKGAKIRRVTPEQENLETVFMRETEEEED